MNRARLWLPLTLLTAFALASGVARATSPRAQPAAESAACADQELAKARASYEALPAGVRTSRQVRGLTLVGTAEELAVAHGVVSDSAPSRWPAAARACAAPITALCALSRAFGSEETAYRALRIGRKYGYFISLSQAYAAPAPQRIWRAEETRALESALERMPPSFYRLPSLRDLIRVGRSSPDAAADASQQDGFIRFFDGSFKDGRLGESAFIHELVHHYDFSGALTSPSHVLAHVSVGFDEINQWTLQWVKEEVHGKLVSVRKPVAAPAAEFGSEYASTNALEDFATTVGEYVYDPERARRMTPKKYALAKRRVFGGREYAPPTQLSAGLAHWFESRGGMRAVLGRCLDERLSGIIYQYGLTLQTRDDVNGTMGFSMPGLGRLACLQGPFNEAIAAQTEACPSRPELVAQLAAEVQSVARRELGPLDDAAAGVGVGQVSACVARKDLRPACWQVEQRERVAQGISRLSVGDALKEQLREQLRDASLGAPKVVVDALLKDAPLAAVLPLCLARATRVLGQGATRTVRFGTKEYWLPAGLPAECAPDVVALATSRGAQVDGLLEQTGMLSALPVSLAVGDFDRKVLTSWFDQDLPACAGKPPACLRSRLGASLKAWLGAVDAPLAEAYFKALSAPAFARP